MAKYSAATAATAVDTTVAKSVDEARPPEFVKHSATTAATAVASTVVKAVGEAQPSGIAKYSATTVVDDSVLRAVVPSRQKYVVPI